MERNEPSLAPEWLRSNGGSTGGSGSNHHFASSQADGPVLALPTRSRSSKSISNTDSLHSPLLDRSSSSNSRRSSNSNGFSKHDKNSYPRSYSNFSRSHRDRDRERSTIADNWDLDYCDPLRGMISGRAEDPLRRSQSLVSRRPGEHLQQRIPADMRNGVFKNHDNGNGSRSSVASVTGTQKVSFERDFPVLGSEERPKTPDVIRVSSPGLSRCIQSLSISNPQSVGSESWTSALVEVPSCPGNNSGAGSIPALHSADTAASSSSSSLSVPVSTSTGLNMAEALVQVPAQAHNAAQPSAQLQRDEFALAQSKKLIPMTPSMPKTLAPSSSLKLKPKTATRSSEIVVNPKNGVHHPTPLQVGSQSVRGVAVRGDGPKSPSSGKLLLLKSGRENGISPTFKDLQSPTAIINNRAADGHSIGNPSVASGPSKNTHPSKISPGKQRTSGSGLNPGAGIDKRTSRSNFFKLMREKSLNNTSGSISSVDSATSDVADNSGKEAKEQEDSAQTTPAVTTSELKCGDETCTMTDSSSPSMEIDNEKERAFLLSLGWEDQAEGDEEGLTEEEIYACYIDVLKQCPTSRLCRVLQAKIFSHVGCSSSNEANSSA
ncbi:hypothetical protein RND81_06G052900 [Saponaria officinalis]|uniref:Uncharacterized protein n=1 Tax=Saponaria officinalis TaxID=3572 RepID=A0AAW1K7Q6_SAPOF